jgi:type I restriction enzyme S subunit
MTISTKQPLGNYVTFKTGKLNSNAAVNDGIYPFFTCAQEIYRTNTWSFDTECVLLGGNNANAIYPIFYYNGKFDAYQRTYVIEPKDNNNIRFFYYAIQKKLGELRQQSTGAATRFLTIGILNNLQIEVPEPAEQLRVSSLLSSYDDLIENNNLRIKILEEMAQRLYAEWFVKFKFPGHEKVKLVDSSLGKIPEGWEIKSLEECSDIQFGFNFKSSNFNEDGEGVMVVRIRDILSGTTKTFSSEFVEDKYKIYPGELLSAIGG